MIQTSVIRLILSFLWVLVLLCCVTPSVFAWGRRGHDIVAEIAFRYLDSADKEKIRTYLDGMSLMDAANWLDEVRSDPNYSNTAPWHYVDFPKGTSYMPTDQPNIVNALSNAIKELDTKTDLSSEQIKFDLLCIIHLSGDIMQPLHVGYPEDKGGNRPS